MSSKKIILVGGGGHCKVIISILKQLDEFEIIGISDIKENFGKKILDVPIKYRDENLSDLKKQGIEYAFVTLGSIGNPKHRTRLYTIIKEIEFKIPTIISKKSFISDDVKIEQGTIIMNGVIINPGTKIGENCIINTGSIIEHDCVIGDNVHIAPGVTISGGVTIQENTHIGTGTSIIQNINIGNNTIIGAGSVVIKNIPNNLVAFGNPADIK